MTSDFLRAWSAGLLAAGQKINASPSADNTAINAFYRMVALGDHAGEHSCAAP